MPRLVIHQVQRPKGAAGILHDSDARCIGGGVRRRGGGRRAWWWPGWVLASHDCFEATVCAAPGSMASAVVAGGWAALPATRWHKSPLAVWATSVMRRRRKARLCVDANGHYSRHELLHRRVCEARVLVNVRPSVVLQQVGLEALIVLQHISLDDEPPTKGFSVHTKQQRLRIAVPTHLIQHPVGCKQFKGVWQSQHLTKLRANSVKGLRNDAAHGIICMPQPLRCLSNRHPHAACQQPRQSRRQLGERVGLFCVRLTQGHVVKHHPRCKLPAVPRTSNCGFSRATHELVMCRKALSKAAPAVL